MENTGFATFSPFTNKMNTPENIANYYADLQQQTGVNLLSNNSNPFMENYLGIKPINEVSTTIESPKKGITD